MRTIIARKLQAAGMPGYCNMSPFDAGSAGVMAPALLEQQQQQLGAPQNQAPPAAPNTVVPSTQQPNDPNLGTSFAAPAPSQPTVDEGSSPLDLAMQQIYNRQASPEQQGGGQQQQQSQNDLPQQPNAGTPPAMLDLMNLPVENIQKVAQGMDFTKGLTESTMAKFQVNPETGQPADLLGGIMELMQHVGGNIYTNSLVGGSKVAGTAMTQRFTDLDSRLPTMMNRQAVASTMQSGEYHQALQPVVSNAVNQMLENNPHTTPEQAKAMTDQLIAALGTHLQPQPEDPEQGNLSAGSSIFDFT